MNGWTTLAIFSAVGCWLLAFIFLVTAEDWARIWGRGDDPFNLFHYIAAIAGVSGFGLLALSMAIRRLAELLDQTA